MHPKLIMLKKIADGLWTYGSDNESMEIHTTIIIQESSKIADKDSPVANSTMSKIVDPKSKKINGREMVPIGSGGTSIQKELYKKVNWSTYTKATRCLLRAVFPRSILATHCLTGKPSPAFKDKKQKMGLDPKKVMDIVEEVRNKFHIKENFIRAAITIACADETKMYRMRKEKYNKKILKSTSPPKMP